MITRQKMMAMALWIAAISPMNVFASSATGLPSIFDRLYSEQILEATLEVNVDFLVEKKKTNDYHPAVFTFTDGTGQEQRWPIEVRARGRFRRVYGEFPPLKLKFPKKALAARGMNHHNDLKLVTNITGTEEGDDYILREYLAYKLYQQMSPYNYRVQLLRLTYKDLVSGKKQASYAILIEDTDEMEDRYQGETCKDCFGMADSLLQQDAVYAHALFQYMIGNTDWSVAMSRNLKLLKLPSGKHVPVPYDFDFSGLVHAKYAIPRAELGQQSITDRVFLAELDQSALAPAIDQFKARREQLLNTIESFDLLSRKSRKEITKYLDQFFIELENGFAPKLPTSPPSEIVKPEIN